MSFGLMLASQVKTIGLNNNIIGLHDPVSVARLMKFQAGKHKLKNQSKHHYLKKLTTKQCFHPDPVLSEMGFTYLMLYQTKCNKHLYWLFILLYTIY